MYMKLFSIGPFTVYSYGLMIAIGILAAVWLGMKRSPARGLDKDQMFNMGFIGIVAGVIGAKLMYYIVELPAIIKNPSLLLDVTNGFVVYGGVLLGILTPYLYCRKKELVFLDYLDAAMPSIPLAQGLGRIGCFLAGCCYGVHTDAWFGVVFPASGLAPAGTALVPTQLISCIGDFAIAGFLLWYTRKGTKRPQGIAVGWYMILYSIGRFIVEFWRADPRGTIGPLSTSQFISIFVLIFGIMWTSYCSSRHKDKLLAEIDRKVDEELAAEAEAKKEKESEWQRVGETFAAFEEEAPAPEEAAEEVAEEEENQ